MLKKIGYGLILWVIPPIHEIHQRDELWTGAHPLAGAVSKAESGHRRQGTVSVRREHHERPRYRRDHDVGLARGFAARREGFVPGRHEGLIE